MTSLKVRFQRPKKAIKTLKIDLLKRNKHWAWFPQCFPGHLGTKNKNRKKHMEISICCLTKTRVMLY